MPIKSGRRKNRTYKGYKKAGLTRGEVALLGVANLRQVAKFPSLKGEAKERYKSYQLATRKYKAKCKAAGRKPSKTKLASIRSAFKYPLDIEPTMGTFSPGVSKEGLNAYM